MKQFVSEGNIIGLKLSKPLTSSSLPDAADRFSRYVSLANKRSKRNMNIIFMWKTKNTSKVFFESSFINKRVALIYLKLEYEPML